MDIEGLRRSKNGIPRNLTYLPQQAEWIDQIFQIENGDEAVGGYNGVANIQAQQLANRTNYLLEVVNGILKFLNQYTADGKLKLTVGIGTSNEGIQLHIPGLEDADPNLQVTFDDNSQNNLLDGNTIIETGGIEYALIGGNDDTSTDTTISPTDTIQSDTPSSIDPLDYDSGFTQEEFNAMFSAEAVQRYKELTNNENNN